VSCTCGLGYPAADGRVTRWWPVGAGWGPNRGVARPESLDSHAASRTFGPMCTFSWGELMEGIRAVPAWTVEAQTPPGRRFRHRVRMVSGTLAIPIVAAPYACRTLRMEQRISASRMLRIPVLCVLTAVLLTCLTVGARFGGQTFVYGRSIGDNAPTALAWSFGLGGAAALCPVFPTLDAPGFNRFTNGGSCFRSSNSVADWAMALRNPARPRQGTAFLPPTSRRRTIANRCATIRRPRRPRRRRWRTCRRPSRPSSGREEASRR